MRHGTYAIELDTDPSQYGGHVPEIEEKVCKIHIRKRVWTMRILRGNWIS